MCRSHFAANDHYSLWRCGYNRDENIFNFALPLPGNPICMRQRCHLKSNSHRVVSLKEYYARDYILKSLEHKDGTHFSSSLQMPCKKLCMVFIENDIVGPKKSRFKNTIGDGGSTALYFTTLFTLFKLFTLFTLLTLFILFSVYAVYTVFTGIWLFRLLSKMLDDGWRVTGYPSGCYDESICGAKKWKIHPEIIFQPQYLMWFSFFFPG